MKKEVEVEVELDIEVDNREYESSGPKRNWILFGREFRLF